MEPPAGLGYVGLELGELEQPHRHSWAVAVLGRAQELLHDPAWCVSVCLSLFAVCPGFLSLLCCLGCATSLEVGS